MTCPFSAPPFIILILYRLRFFYASQKSKAGGRAGEGEGEGKKKASLSARDWGFELRSRDEGRRNKKKMQGQRQTVALLSPGADPAAFGTSAAVFASLFSPAPPPHPETVARISTHHSDCTRTRSFIVETAAKQIALLQRETGPAPLPPPPPAPLPPLLTADSVKLAR